MTSRWTPGALLLAMLALLVAGCGTGVPLVGNDDAGVVISFDQPMSDIGEPDDINYDGANDFVPGELPDAVLVDQTPGCVDNDRDGFGLGTCRGIDCDDRDPRITTQCYEGCFYPDVRDGCSCEPGTQPLPCDLTTGRSSGPDGVCNLGQRTCAPNRTGAGWSWGACERWRQDFRFVGPISACPGSCLPTCRHQIVCPTPADPASASRPAGSSGVSIGSGAQAVFCPTGTPNGGITSTCTPVMGTAYARGTTPPVGPLGRRLRGARPPHLPPGHRRQLRRLDHPLRVPVLRLGGDGRGHQLQRHPVLPRRVGAEQPHQRDPPLHADPQRDLPLLG
jgi:hypothetical protein